MSGGAGAPQGVTPAGRSGTARSLARGARGALLALLALLAAACAPSDGPGDGITVSFRLDPAVPSVGTADLELRLVDAAGEPITGADVDIEANMNHAGMTPTFAEPAESPDQPGVYEGELEFTMGGDWFLLLEARLPDGTLVERKLDVPGVRSG